LSKSSVILFTAALAALFLPHSASAQTAANISVVQGNGQLACDGCANTALLHFDPLVVKVTDASGNPVPNATVTWTVVSSTGSFAGTFANQTTVTGSSTSSSAVLCSAYDNNPGAVQANGLACNKFFEGSAATPALGPIYTTVSASIANGQAVTLYLTQSPLLNPTVVDTNYIYAQLSPTSTIPVGTTVSGPVNSVYPNGSIAVVAQTISGTKIPNISVRLVPQTPNQGGASISCQTSGTDADPGSVLTDNTGTALCVPVFGSTPGSSAQQFQILVGGVPSLQDYSNASSYNQGLGYPAGQFSFSPFYATATPITPGSLTLVSGNSQTAQAGSAVANPLVVTVADTNGNALPGVTVTWSVSPANAATLTPATSTSGSNGQAQTTVTLASSANGTVTVTASVSGLTTTVPFTITAMQPLPTITGLSIVSGNNQSAQTGAAFAAPLVVQVAPVTANVTIQFSISGGSGVLSASSAVTQSNGQASIGVTAGSTAGPLTVVASVATFSQTFSLTVTPPAPPVSATSFLNGAGFFSTSATSNNQTALSPCGIGTLVVGSSLVSLPITPNMYAAPLQQTNGITITFPSAAGTSAATLLNVSTPSTGLQLITFQVPCDATPSFASVVVTINGTSVTVPGVAVRPGAPGIFELVSSDGVRRAVAVRANGTYVGPQNPAQPGEFVTIYVTGVGPVIPALATGQLPVAGVNIVPADSGQVVVGLDGNGVGAVTVTASPDLIGVYLVTFQIPSNTSTTAADHVLAVGVTAEGNPTQYQQPGGSKLYVQ
jgi:uncharacterized protein (TIGR03437 family)